MKVKLVPRSILVRRFWDKVHKGARNECWLFGKQNTPTHYPMLWNGRRTRGAHIFSLELKLGRKLRPGMFALHRCDYRPCVNPHHLFEGTSLDNSRDMVAKGRKERGSQVGSAKLDEEKVLKIRKYYARGETAETLAEEFGVCSFVILCAVKGKTWKHVGGPIGARSSGGWIRSRTLKDIPKIRIQIE